MRISAFGTAVLTCVVVGHPPPAVAQVDRVGDQLSGSSDVPVLVLPLLGGQCAEPVGDGVLELV